MGERSRAPPSRDDYGKSGRRPKTTKRFIKRGLILLPGNADHLQHTVYNSWSEIRVHLIYLSTVFQAMKDFK